MEDEVREPVRGRHRGPKSAPELEAGIASVSGMSLNPPPQAIGIKEVERLKPPTRGLRGQKLSVCKGCPSEHMQGPVKDDCCVGWGRQPLAGQGHRDNDAILAKGQYWSQTPGLQVGEGMGRR